MSEQQTGRLIAALELLRHKTICQLREGNKYCYINDKDIKEILIVAGMSLETEVDLIDIKQKDPTTH